MCLFRLALSSSVSSERQHPHDPWKELNHKLILVFLLLMKITALYKQLDHMLECLGLILAGTSWRFTKLRGCVKLLVLLWRLTINCTRPGKLGWSGAGRHISQFFFGTEIKTHDQEALIKPNKYFIKAYSGAQCRLMSPNVAQCRPIMPKFAFYFSPSQFISV